MTERLTFMKCPKQWRMGRHPTKYSSRQTFQQVVDRLAEYENTGLTPEEVKMAIAALREQEERSKGCEFCKGAKYIYCDMSASGVADETHDFVHEWHGDVTICPVCGRRLEET